MAQTPIEEFQNYRDLYPEDNAVILDSRRVLSIDIVADTLSILLEEYSETLILDNPTQRSKDRVFTSSFSEVFDIEAYTLIPGKKKYKKAPVEDFKKSYDKDSYVFYDDTEWINYNYPLMDVGVKIVTKYKRKITDPHIISQFFFASYIPTIKTSFEVVVSDEVEVLHGLYNDHMLAVNFKEQKMDEGRRSLIYEADNIPKIEYESDNPAYSYLSSSVYLTIANYATSAGKFKVLSSVEDLHTWYQGFLTDLTIGEDVKSIAKSIVDDADSDLEKVKKIFYWVQKNVKYIAFEQGMRGFIPHPAAYVMNKRYGDCKDMTSLLVGLMRSQDIAGNFTWIGTRDLPYSYSEIPSPIVDNHMIASVVIDGKTLFLDATGNYTPLGFPTSMIQGKQSLIDKTGTFELKEVPVVPKEENLMIDSSVVRLEENVLYGSGSLQLTGLVKVANTYNLIQRTQKGEENYLRRLLSRGSNKFLLDDFTVKNVDDLDLPIEIDYTFQIGDYYREIGNELYINLCLEKSLISDVIKDRVTPRKNDYKYVNRSVTTLSIPVGYEVSFLPDNATLSTNNFGYELSYKIQGDKIIASKEFYVDYLLLETTAFDEWNSSIKEYAKAVRNTVILKKTTASE